MTARDRAVVRRLIDFLPLARQAEASERRFAQQASYWDRESETYYYRGVRYPDEFERFRDILVEAGWLDMDYDQEEGFRHIHRLELIRDVSFETARQLLTFCDRGERFAEGFWGESFEDGFVRRVLERLVELAAAEDSK
jgi:hypothetical protein